MSDRRGGWWIVARWELRRTLRRADFILSVLLTPVLLLAVVSGSQWMEDRSRSRIRTIAVAWEGGAPDLDSLRGVRWLVARAAETERDSLVRAVRERRYGGALRVPSDFATGGRSELILRREMPSLQLRIEAFLKKAAREERARARGLDSTGLAHLDGDIALAVAMADRQTGASRADQAVALALVFLVMMVTFVAGSYVMIGISAEKQARVTEIIVSSIPAQAWMDGKIFAYSVLGLITELVWALAGVATLLTLMPTLPSSVNPLTVVLSIIYGTLGFALYVAFFAAVMATLKDFSSASKLQGNFLIIPVFPVFFLSSVLESPEAPLAIATSLFPLFSPTLMPMRIALGQAPAWQIALGLAILAGGVWVMRRLAGTAFRIGMLLYGKDVTLPELIRLSRRS